MFFDDICKPIHEVYFGKTKELLEIEQKLDVFRSKNMNKHVLNAKCNSSPELLEIDKLFEDAFGFGVCSLTVIDDPSPNAFTMPVTCKFDINPNYTNVIANPTKGFRFDKSLDYCLMICIHSGLIFNPNFTTEEVLAIILHEVGHNFYASLNRKNTVLAGIRRGIYLASYIMSNYFVGIILNINSVNAMVERIIKELIKQNSIIMDIKYFYNNIMGLIRGAQTVATDILRILSFNFLGALSRAQYIVYNILHGNPLSYILLPLTYRDERAADNFPTMYGYGPAKASALRKMEEAGNTYSKTINAIETMPVISSLFNAVPLPFHIMLVAFDPHPNHLVRIVDQMDLLKKELAKTDLDPRMKKKIQEEVDLIQKEIDKFTDVKRGLKDPDLARHAYYRLMYKITKGKAFKDLIFDDRSKFYEYDKTYFDQLERDN